MSGPFHPILISISAAKARAWYRSRTGHWGQAMEDELQYYARRAAEERQAAAVARSAKAERLHRELAERYSLIADGRDAPLRTAAAAD